MKGTKRIIAVFLLLTLIFTVGVPVSAEKQDDTINFTVTGTVNYDYAFEVLEILNELRISLGKEPLKMDYTLMNDAMLRAAETGILFSHTRPIGEKCFTAITEAYFSAAENIAAGQTSPTAVMNSWKNSSGHYNNMVSDVYETVGIGCFKSSNGCWCWVQLFNSNSANEKTVQGSEERTFNIEAKKENLGMDLRITKIPCGLKKGDTFSFEFENVNTEFSYVKQKVDSTSLIFVSSDENVLELSADGTATVKGSGVADITVTDKNGGVFFSAQYDSCHIYNDCCETECVFCGYARTAPHSVLPAPCDQEKVCSLCGITVSGGDKHKFSGAGDAFCNICNEERTLIYVKGDADGDQKVTTTDLATLKLYLAQIAELEEVSKKLCDLDGDKNVNTVDLAMLKLKLAGIE